MEKEKRDKEMKGEVDRLWQHYFAESGGKIRSKAEARERGSLAEACGKYGQQSKRHLHRSRQMGGGRRGRQMRARPATGACSALSRLGRDLVV